MRKITWILTFTLLLTTFLPLYASAEQSSIPVLDDLDQAEITLYGNPNKTEAVVQRLDKMEKTLYGGTFPTSIPERVSQMKKVLTYDTEGSPSLIFQLKGDEWIAQQKISYGPLLPRLDSIEKTLTGVSSEGTPVLQKLQKINSLCFKNGVVPSAAKKVEQGTLVKVEFLTALSSGKNRAGDPVEFQVVDNVYVDGMLVIPAGSRATGEVTKAASSKSFGKNGKLEMDFKTVDGFDGTPIALVMGDKAKDENKNMAYAAGASVTGAILLGPIGLVGGAFVKGKQIEIPIGTKMFLEVKDSANVIGLAVNNLTPAQ